VHLDFERIEANDSKLFEGHGPGECDIDLAELIIWWWLVVVMVRNRDKKCKRSTNVAAALLLLLLLLLQPHLEARSNLRLEAVNGHALHKKACTRDIQCR
jgi:hypothetical protein